MDGDGTVTVTLGEKRDFAESLVRSGRYVSLTHVVQDALDALAESLAEQEAWESDPATIAWMREKVQESLDDPRPDIPAEEVFADLERRYAEDAKAKRSAA